MPRSKLRGMNLCPIIESQFHSYFYKMPLSPEECLDLIKNKVFAIQDECSYVANEIFDLLSCGSIFEGTSHESLITMLHTIDDAIFQVDYTVTESLGHSFILIQHGFLFSLYQSFINGYRLIDWLSMTPSQFMPDTSFSPSNSFSQHAMVKFLNMLEHDLKPTEQNKENLAATFKRMFGGNPTSSRRLTMALNFGLGTSDSTWHWRKCSLKSHHGRRSMGA